MMKNNTQRFLCIQFFCVLSFNSNAQKSRLSHPHVRVLPAQPRLVVGLVIDQMRWDFLHRYASHYGEGGFKRLMREGFSCDNTMITHIPTYTAVGHASVYTGSYPSIHGIVGNDWYDYKKEKNVYCTEDSTTNAVGGSMSEGKMSPRNLLSTTITDELRLSTNFKSKVIGISLKDRGAIIPAGQSANAAYWYDDLTGTMMSSTYYMDELPKWVQQFNRQARPDAYMKDGWSRTLAAGDEENSTADDMPFEANMPGSSSHTFPYTFNLDSSNKYKVFKTTPMSMAYSFDFAKKTIDEEKMGKGKVTDFLALSISSTDYIGHTFGPNSMENQDAYLHLDKYLADFLQYLDKNFGKENYLLFLTADHGVAHNPQFLQEHRIHAGVIKTKEWMKIINDSVEARFKLKNVVSAFQNYQLYFSADFMQKHAFSIPVVSAYITTYLEKQPEISRAFLLDKTQETVLPDVIKTRVINSIHAKRSGHVQIIPEPGYFSGSMKGTTHGTWNPYDAHIPLLWMGWHVGQGKTNDEVHMTDIAPTLAALLNIQEPSGSVGKVVERLIVKP